MKKKVQKTTFENFKNFVFFHALLHAQLKEASSLLHHALARCFIYIYIHIMLRAIYRRHLSQLGLLVMYTRMRIAS